MSNAVNAHSKAAATHVRGRHRRRHSDVAALVFAMTVRAAFLCFWLYAGCIQRPQPEALCPVCAL